MVRAAKLRGISKGSNASSLYVEVAHEGRTNAGIGMFAKVYAGFLCGQPQTNRRGGDVFDERAAAVWSVITRVDANAVGQDFRVSSLSPPVFWCVYLHCIALLAWRTYTSKLRRYILVDVVSYVLEYVVLFFKFTALTNIAVGPFLQHHSPQRTSGGSEHDTRHHLHACMPCAASKSNVTN